MVWASRARMAQAFARLPRTARAARLTALTARATGGAVPTLPPALPTLPGSHAVGALQAPMRCLSVSASASARGEHAHVAMAYADADGSTDEEAIKEIIEGLTGTREGLTITTVTGGITNKVPAPACLRDAFLW